MNDLSPHDSQLIDNFLTSQISESERVRFNERLADPLFKQELEFRSSLMEVSEQKGQEKLYTLLEEESRRMDLQKPIQKYRMYWIGLALLAIAGLYYFLTSHEPEPSNEEIFFAHYEVFPNLIAPTERSNDVKLNGAEMALYAYDNRDFQKAVTVFDTLSAMNTDLMMYHAIAAFEAKQVDQAENLLIGLSNNNQARYREAAQWYLCLLYLHENDMTLFNDQRSKIISNSSHTYHNKVRQLNLDVQ